MYFCNMRTISFVALFLGLLVSSASLGQSFFQEVSELGHTEQTDLLKKYQSGRSGTEKMIIQRRLDFFSMKTIRPISKEKISSFTDDQKLCIHWQDAYDFRHEQNYVAALKLCDSVMRTFDLSVYQKAEFHRFIGVTYHIWGDFPAALENLRIAERLFLKANSQIGQIVCAYNIANAYMSANHLKEFENSLKVFTKSYGDVIHKYPYYQGNFNSLFLSREFLNDNYEAAFQLTLKNIDLYIELKDSFNISRSSFNAAIASGYAGRQDSTMSYLRFSKRFKAGEAHPKSQAESLISLMVFLSNERLKREVLDLYGLRDMEHYFGKIDQLLTQPENENLRLKYLRQYAVYLQELDQPNELAKILDEENDLLYKIISKDTLNSALINYKLELEKTKNAELGYQKTIAANSRDKLANKVRQNKYWTIAYIIIGFLIIVIIARRYTHLKRTQKMKYLRDLEELKNKQLNEELKQTHHRLEEFRTQLIEKSKLIDEAKGNLNLSSEEQVEYYEKMRQMKILTDDDWYKFKELFESVHPSMKTFLIDNSISLTEGELRILMLFKLKYDRRHMGDMLGIGSESIRKAIYRLKKKLEPKELELVVMEF